jgi:hypothetical protein
MTRTQKIKYNQILKNVKVLEGRKDCLKAYQLLLRELRTFELRIPVNTTPRPS